MSGTSNGAPVPPEEIRASDAEREAVVARLNSATSEGRLALDEFSERVERAYQARTRRDLEDLVVDLPPAATPGTAPAIAGGSGQPARTAWQVLPMGGVKRSGRWRSRGSLSVTLLGGVSLDLREAELASREVTVTAVTVVGGVDVVVPSGMRVEIEGISLLGGRRLDVDERAAPGAPTLRLRVFSVLGGVRVRSKRPFDRWRNAARSGRL